VKSIRGQGSSFVIKIPLTLAIISSLIIEASGELRDRKALAVMELVRVGGNSEHRIERIKDARVLRLRNKLLPLAHLRTLLKTGEEPDGDKGFIVVMQVGNRVFGIVVDGVLHTEEIVVKPMSSKLRHIGMFSGNTILGDGSVIMIIDPNGVADAVGSSASMTAEDSAKAEAEHYAESRSRVPLLLFRAGSPQLKAVPLSLVVRLEEIDTKRIELSNGRHVVQYRGQLMPLLRVNDDVRIKDDGVQPILVFSDGGRSMGLVVDEIVDIVEDKLEIEVTSDHPGVLGSGIIKEEATEIIDVGHFMPMALGEWFRGGARPGGGQNLLFVDDSAFFRNMLTPVLQLAGYKVTAVESAQDGIALIQAGRRFDIVVTDLEMPGMNGFQLAAAIRSEPRTSGVPIIALSAGASPELLARVRQARFDDCVGKFDRQGLIAALKEQSADMNEAA
jgi:two-component system, chemotaxis family, sensor kinase CheA